MNDEKDVKNIEQLDKEDVYNSSLEYRLTAQADSIVIKDHDPDNPPSREEVDRELNEMVDEMIRKCKAFEDNNNKSV